MPIDDRRVVVVTPAGRRRYLSILFPYVLALHTQGLVDEYRIWVNTANAKDVDFIENLAATNDFVTTEHLPDGVECDSIRSIYHFFKRCTDPNTVYVRFDDDIVMLDNTNTFEAFVRFRMDNPEPFLVYANILNNSVIAHIHKKAGTLSLADFDLKYDCMNSPAWTNPACAEALHSEVLTALTDDGDGGLSRFRLPTNPVFSDYERVSINCISWLGEDFASFGGDVGQDEENWLSTVRAREIQRPNCMFGGYVCVHFAFHTQREHLENACDGVHLRAYAELAGVRVDPAHHDSPKKNNQVSTRDCRRGYAKAK
jgi:hypothetical protein